jgi:pyruvate dehydrogenase E2 component (dihydrolipoamide acetyltransferase)
MIEEIKIPEISENVKSGNVVSVLVREGDMVNVDDVLIEFETEKAVVEIPSPVKGKITELLAKEGLEMKIGDVIARVDTAAQAEEVPEAKEPVEVLKEAEPLQSAAEEPVAAAAGVEEPQEPEREPEEVAAATGLEAGEQEDTQKPIKAEKERAAGLGPAPASPSVRRFARELGVDIYAVAADHPGGRITEADIKAYVRKRRPPEVSRLATTAPSGPGRSKRSNWPPYAASLPRARLSRGRRCPTSPSLTKRTSASCRRSYRTTPQRLPGRAPNSRSQPSSRKSAPRRSRSFRASIAAST